MIVLRQDLIISPSLLILFKHSPLLPTKRAIGPGCPDVLDCWMMALRKAIKIFKGKPLT
jgi:hypothetical protein